MPIWRLPGQLPTSHFTYENVRFDRAYNDFGLWQKIVANGSDFTTRLKTSKTNRDLERKVLRGQKEKSGVLYDEEYISTAPAAKFSAIKLRHIIYRDKLTPESLPFCDVGSESQR
ncbi:MAG: hypothetical protein IPJ84_14635 [Bdellovibrionales bacterium]|nr:hypothetical protein [Bdellovibrionales bacterium]